MTAGSLSTIYLSKQRETLLPGAALVAGGAVLLALLAQISIPLPFTPVPLTGQTFGVALLSLLLGWRRAPLTVLLYLAAGAAGAPVLAGGRAGISWGPTPGYLGGMALASVWIGYLAEAGWARSFWRAWAATTMGSIIVFSCGLLVLALFVPASGLLAAGLWPFLPGDLLKNILAAGAASACARYSSR